MSNNSALLRSLLIVFAVLILMTTGVDFMALEDPAFIQYTVSALRPLYNKFGIIMVLIFKGVIILSLITGTIILYRKARQQKIRS